MPDSGAVDQGQRDEKAESVSWFAGDAKVSTAKLLAQFLSRRSVIASLHGAFSVFERSATRRHALAHSSLLICVSRSHIPKQPE